MSKEAHSLASEAVPEIAPAVVDYLPPMPKSRTHPIALIGAGGIASAHLDGYRRAGFNVRVIASPTLARAVARRDEFFPAAEATDDVDGTAPDAGDRLDDRDEVVEFALDRVRLAGRAVRGRTAPPAIDR